MKKLISIARAGILIVPLVVVALLYFPQYFPGLAPYIDGAQGHGNRITVNSCAPAGPSIDFDALLGPAAANAQVAPAPPVPFGAPTGPLGKLAGGGPTGGISQGAMFGVVTGVTTLTANSTLVTVPQAGFSPIVYPKCFVSLAIAPIAGVGAPACVVTSTTTVLATSSLGAGSSSPTATTGVFSVGAVALSFSGTPATTPIVNWFLSR